MAWFLHQKRLGQDESNFLIFLRSTESIFRDANPANVAKSLLDRNNSETNEARMSSGISKQLYQ